MSDVSKEYGAALYLLAREENVAEELLNETRTAEDVLRDNPAYIALLSSPDLSKEERSAAVVRAFAGGHRFLLNFLSMMVERGYSREIVDEAKSEADRLRRRADEEIAQEKKKALNEIKNDISDISVEIAEKVVGREIREEDHREMIDAFIRDLEDGDRV